MQFEKESVLIYGTGAFFHKYKTEIENAFKICGYIDRDKQKLEIDNFLICHSVSEYKGKFDHILVMTEKPNIIFEMVRSIRSANIPARLIVLGISNYGFLSSYFDFRVCDDYRIKIRDKDYSCFASNPDVFIQCLKTRMREICMSTGGGLKKSLEKLYEDELKVLWMDGRLWCQDHDIDIYYRFPKDGFFNWGYCAVFSLMAIKQFVNPCVLDIGCGDGYYFRRFFKYINGIRYTGCDFSHEEIDRAIRNNFDANKIADFIVADMVNSMPYPKDKRYFDVILWNGSFSVFDDECQDRIVKEGKERCGEEGVFVVCDYYSSKKSPWVYSKNITDEIKLMDLFKKYFNNVYLHIDEYSEAFYLLASNGRLPMYNSRL